MCCRWNTYCNERPTVTFSTDFILNCKAAADYSYHFFNVVIKWPSSVNNALNFASSSLNEAMWNGLIPKCEKVIVSNPSHPDPGQREIHLNFYFHTSLWCIKRFYEDLKDLHKTFWGTTKKCENRKLSELLF